MKLKINSRFISLEKIIVQHEIKLRNELLLILATIIKSQIIKEISYTIVQVKYKLQIRIIYENNKVQSINLNSTLQRNAYD